MNFEAELANIQLVEKLYTFLTLLRSALKSLVGEHAEVIWYDSVDPVSGKVWWKSALTPQNSTFLDLCDGFFTDYHWDLARLDQTAQIALSMNWKLDVYVGNDIYGRGTYAGGKF